MCDCSFYLSLRSIIDAGLKPTILNITSIIATYVERDDVDFLFIIGNIFTLACSSPLYTLYKMILQDSLNVSIELKEEDTQGFIFQEDICQLLQPVVDERPYMYDSFSIGNLHQVSRETYGIYVIALYKNSHHYPGDDSKPFSSCVSNKSDSINVVGGEDSAMVIIQKGQPIPSTGFVKKFNVELNYFGEYEDTDIFSIELGNKPTFTMIFVTHMIVIFISISKTKTF